MLQFLKSSFLYALLPRKKIMLDYICMGSVQLQGTLKRWKIQNSKFLFHSGIRTIAKNAPQLTSPPPYPHSWISIIVSDWLDFYHIICQLQYSVFPQHCFSFNSARVIFFFGVQLSGFIHLSHVTTAIRGLFDKYVDNRDKSKTRL